MSGVVQCTVIFQSKKFAGQSGATYKNTLKNAPVLFGIALKKTIKIPDTGEIFTRMSSALKGYQKVIEGH